MKKFIKLALLLILLPTTLHAQRLRGGIVAGYDYNVPQSYFDNKSGFHIGLQGEVDIVKGLFAQTALTLEGRRYCSNTVLTTYGGSWQSKPYYLSIPVHVGYKFAVADNVKLSLSAGPKFDIGLFGKYNTKVLNQATDYHGNVFSDNYFNRFDVALGAKVGVELFNHYQVGIGYNWGLKNIVKNGPDAKNRQLQVTLGYMF